VAAGAIVLGGPDRLPNTSCLALPGVRAETQVIALDLAGIQVSAGAACSSGKVSRSHVLDAMYLGPLAGEAIRVSLPWSASRADVEAFAVAYTETAGRLGRRAA
jgi:cysteine desulfurase